MDIPFKLCLLFYDKRHLFVGDLTFLLIQKLLQNAQLKRLVEAILIQIQ